MLSQHPFIPSRYYKTAYREAVDYVVIHTMELPCVPGMAQRCAEKMRDLPPNLPGDKQKSAHYFVDPYAIFQGVPEKHVAYHCPNANRRGIGIEHAAYALGSYPPGQGYPTDFAGLEAAAMLELSVGLVAEICSRWGIPIVRLLPGQILHGRGIVGHVDVAAEFKSSNHRDPGPRWPWDSFLEAVRGKWRPQP